MECRFSKADGHLWLSVGRTNGPADRRKIVECHLCKHLEEKMREDFRTVEADFYQVILGAILTLLTGTGGIMLAAIPFPVLQRPIPIVAILLLFVGFGVGVFIKKDTVGKYLARKLGGTKIELFPGHDNQYHAHMGSVNQWSWVDARTGFTVQLGGVSPKHSTFGANHQDWFVADASKGLGFLTLGDAHGFKLERLYWTEALRIANTFRSVVELRAAAFAKDQLEKQLEQATGEFQLLEKEFESADARTKILVQSIRILDKAARDHDGELLRSFEVEGLTTALSIPDLFEVREHVLRALEAINSYREIVRIKNTLLLGLTSGMKSIVRESRAQRSRSPQAAQLRQRIEELLATFGFHMEGLPAKAAK